MQTDSETIQDDRIPPPQDEPTYKAMLTEDQVRRIRTRYKEGGLSYRELAHEYGVSKTAITNIFRRRTWKRLDP